MSPYPGAMPDLLHALRCAFEHELALYGSFLPLGAPPEATPDSLTPTLRQGPPPPHELTKYSNVTTLGETPPSSTEDPASMANFDLFGQQLDPSKDPSLSPWERINALIPADSPLHHLTMLEDVEAYVNNTVLIPLDEARINAVMGVGNPNANLVIIGEAPGADEDKHGEPFVGRAGQLLNKILAAINFKRDEVYITNILKSRPPNNRDPLPAEIEAHIPLLYKQLTLIKPLVLLAVGKTAGNSLLKRRSSLGGLRNTFHDYHGIPMIVTYHPAALLRNAQWKRPTWDDMKLLRTRYDQLVNEKQARL